MRARLKVKIRGQTWRLVAFQDAPERRMRDARILGPCLRAPPSLLKFAANCAEFLSEIYHVGKVLDGLRGCKIGVARVQCGGIVALHPERRNCRGRKPAAMRWEP